MSVDAGVTLITAFAQIPVRNPVRNLFTEDGSEETYFLELVKVRQLLQHARIAFEVDQMHYRISVTTDNIRPAARDENNKLTNIRPVNFTIGDYALLGCPQPAKVSKLTVRWSGPARVMQIKMPLVAVVEDLRNGKLLGIHEARLNLYHDLSLNVDEEVITYLSFHTKHLSLVDGVKEVGRNRRRGFNVLASWVSFPDEDFWESLKSLYQDVPDRLQTYLEANRSTPTA